MADPRLLRRLDQVSGRMRRWRALNVATIGWGILSVSLAALCWIQAWTSAFWVICLGLIVIPLCAVWWGRRTPNDARDAAIYIEKTYPELDSRLLTAVQQHPQSGGEWNFSFLQTELLSEVFAQLRHQDWHRAVGRAQLWTSHAIHALVLLVALTLSWKVISQVQTIRGVHNAVTLAPAESRDQQTWNVSIEPGNVELERGTSLLVTARFKELVPADVELVARDKNGIEIRVPLIKNLDDPFFGGRLSVVQHDLTYHVEFAGEKSDEFVVTTFDYPELVQADATVNFPKYTGLEPKQVPDVQRLTLVEGSKLNLNCLLNKPVRSAILTPADTDPVPLTASEETPLRRKSEWSFTQPGEHRYKLLLEDEQGRTNKNPPEFRITVVPNEPPHLKVSFPSKDVRVSALQELLLSAVASDDFGLKELGLAFQTPDGKEATIPLSKSRKANEKAEVSHLLAMEKLDAKPDDLVSYYFYAEDVGPDGQPRRSFSDIFFAEVRPFEETYRQVPSEPGQGEGEGAGEGDSKDLLDIQRQVVAATWNLIRREKQDPPSTRFSDDAKTLAESQYQVEELTEAYRAQLKDAMLKEIATHAIQHMQRGGTLFKQASSGPTIQPLPNGQAAAQDAYRSLLRLQARENLLRQSQGQGKPGQNSSQRMNRQMQALKLKNDQNRYETERKAQAENAAAVRETQRVLNQLRELAQRQADLNERLRELESALRNAETPEERSEIERQLKRLQEEQRELLRDLDDARERMNEEANRQNMTDSREQADAARERVQRTSDALQKGQVSQALTEGARAQRDLQQLENEIRKQAAGQFDEAMRDLREQARDLAEGQKEISERMKGSVPDETTASADRKGPRSLRDEKSSTGPRKDPPIVAELNEQKQKLADALEKTKQIVEESETSEPLLSRKLYDTLRTLREHSPEEELTRAIMMSQRGMDAEAQKYEARAREGIEKLQSGIEDAARSVLGDEETALKLAQANLSKLTESIQKELEELEALEQKRGQPDSASQRNGPSSDPQQRRDTSEQNQQMGNPTEASSSAGKNSTDKKPAQGNPATQEGQKGEQANTPGEGKQSTPNKSSNKKADSAPRQPGQQQEQPAQAQQQEGGQGNQSRSNSSQAGSPQDQANQGQAQQGGAQQSQAQQDGSQSLLNSLSNSLGGGTNNADGGAEGAGAPFMPLTGEGFREWADRLRDVEEILPTSDLRSKAAVIRDRARLERMEVKRHSKAPDKEMVRASIYGPLMELQQQIAEELARRNPDKKLVPIDRQPVPEKYSKMVKEYYEELSRQKLE